MKRLIIFSIFNTIFLQAIAQQQTTPDSVRRLEEVVVKAYASDRAVTDVPAAIGVLDASALNRFNNASLVPAFNTIPGVRMEERSPGSYRLSIRGSTLRSPFGVRNVKVYWNGLPLTDGGGNTYLNILDFNSINQVEVVKGPGASLYGAGTGGVVLLNSQLKGGVNVDLHFMAGSYGLLRYGGSTQMLSKKGIWKATFNQQQSNGYREQTRMSRFAAQIQGITSIGKRSTLSTILFASYLNYQTPGGLTKAQFDADPRQARPATATLPGAVQQKASINNSTTYVGFVHEINWNESWLTRTGVYGSGTDFKNPAVLNYEKRWEGNVGGRTETQYKFKKSTWQGKFTVGGEFQYFYSPIEVYTNSSGTPAAIRTIDTLTSRAVLGFAQVEFDLPKQFYLTIGGSSNFLNYHFERSAPAIAIQDRKFDPQFSPRVALLKKINSSFSVYGSVSSGFSPPTLAEVRPSAGNFNNTLNPERGVSYEVGIKGRPMQQFAFDLTAYDFQLRETIVIQRTPDGADYFINAGETSQKGVEAKVSWEPLLKFAAVSSFRFWSSYSLNDYHFKDYINDSKDYSGNLLTGVAPNVAVAGMDLNLLKNFYANITATYVDHTPLNDANSEFASEFFLLGTRIGYKGVVKRFPFEIFGGADNLLDETYSLGNDLNATGGRYYNAAAGRNFYAGIRITLFQTTD
jgi:iron complex outermembrane recepter protein